MNYSKAYDELRLFNIDVMGSGQWLQWFINDRAAKGRGSIDIPPGRYELTGPHGLVIPHGVRNLNGASATLYRE